MRNIFFLSLFCLLVTSAFAQQDNMQMTPEAQKYVDYMTPGPMQEVLAKQVGTWKTINTSYWDPANPVVIEGTAKFEMILGGRFQQSTHAMPYMGKMMEGVGITAYDNVRNIFMTTWMDNMSTSITYLEGKWDEATKTTTFIGAMTDPLAGGPVPYKETVKEIDANHILIEMFMMVDGKEVKNMTVELSR